MRYQQLLYLSSPLLWTNFETPFPSRLALPLLWDVVTLAREDRHEMKERKTRVVTLMYSMRSLFPSTHGRLPMIFSGGGGRMTGGMRASSFNLPSIIYHKQSYMLSQHQQQQGSWTATNAPLRACASQFRRERLRCAFGECPLESDSKSVAPPAAF